MKYNVLEHFRLVDLISIVNKEIKKGWKPLGGINTHSDMYSQALVLPSYRIGYSTPQVELPMLKEDE